MRLIISGSAPELKGVIPKVRLRPGRRSVSDMRNALHLTTRVSMSMSELRISSLFLENDINHHACQVSFVYDYY